MAKHKGKGKGGEQGEAVFERPPERIASPFKNALGSLKEKLAQAEKAQAEAKKLKLKPEVRPVPPVKRAKLGREDENLALSLAMHGVVPLAEKKAARVTTGPRVQSRTASVAPFGRSAEDEARLRLDALVVQDVKFRIDRDHDFVEGARIELGARIVRELARRTRVSDSLDLHGLTQRDAREAVSQFVRSSQRMGYEIVRIVHGKGQRSEGGVGVLREAVVDALTQTLAAPHVRAFVTASDALGGTGALVVELIQR
jgi:DNA-nicking Smr family endonuclease